MACLDTIAEHEAGRPVDPLKLATARWTVMHNRMPTRAEIAECFAHIA